MQPEFLLVAAALLSRRELRGHWTEFVTRSAIGRVALSCRRRVMKERVVGDRCPARRRRRVGNL